MNEFIDQKEHRIAVLNDVNDADEFITVTESKISLHGSDVGLVSIVASALVTDKRFRLVFSRALELALDYENSQKNG